MSIDWDSAVLAPLNNIFGEPAIFTPFDGDDYSITAIFDDAYQSISVAGGMPVNTTQPIAGVRLAEFPVLPQQDDRLLRPKTGELFAIKDVQPDSHGGAKLLLQATA